MILPSDTSRRSAISNALSSIREEIRFPKKVLIGDWGGYLFFDTFGTIFDSCFIDVKNVLLTEEKASIIAMINLGDNTTIDHRNPPVIFIEQATEAKEYVSKLEKKGSPIGWRFLMDRYVCASDTGTWSIYCEKQNNLAVFAFREGFPKSICSQVETLLRAKSIKHAAPTGNSSLFDFIDLLPEWRFTLVTEYGPSL